MKRKILALVLALALSLSLSSCGSNSNEQASPLHYQDIYGHGILTPEEKEQREELKQAVLDCLPEKMREMDCSISIKPQWAEVNLTYSENYIRETPDSWEATVEDAQMVCSDLDGVLQGNGARAAVLYLSDANHILLTVSGGELLYNQFGKSPKKEAVEINTTMDPGSIESDFESAEAIVGSVVYVSDRSNTIHSFSDCSGMKNYREMSREEADENGYQYCPNCW